MIISDEERTDVILLVDDEPSNIQVLNKAVSSLGKVYFATSGEEALRLAREVLPDLVLMDIQMPGIDGFDACTAIKTDPKLQDTNVIFVSAHIDTEHQLRAIQCGGIDFLHKPVNTILAEAQVRTHLTLGRQQRELKVARSTLQNVIDHLPAFVAYWNEDLINVFSNDVEGKWLSVSSAHMQGSSFSSVTRNSTSLSQAAHEQLNLAVEQSRSGVTQVLELTLNSTSSAILFAAASVVPTLIEGKFSGIVLLLHDVTPLRVIQNDLRKEKELFALTLSSIGDGVIVTNLEGDITFLNPIAELLTGWARRDALNQTIETVMPLVDASGRKKLINPLRIALSERRVVGASLNAKLIRRTGEMVEVEDTAAPIKDANNELQGGIIVFHDVTEAREMAQRMSHIASHDALTNLPNRILLQDRSERALENAKRKNEKVAMLVVDIDQFKTINDSVGHSVGDQLLKSIAKRLVDSARGADTVSRHGGDEFIVLVPELTNWDNAVAYVTRLMQQFTTPIWIDSQRFDLTCSVGISIYPDDCSDTESLYRHADGAMYRAKELGRNRWHFFSKDIETQVMKRHGLEQYLRRALVENLFQIYYQAKIDTRTGAVVGVEALIRLKDEKGKMISPAEFIPLAEDNGLIIPIGRVVMELASRDALKWQDMGFNHTVSINISTVQFNDERFVDDVRELFDDLSLKPELIEFEITEGAIAKNTVRTKEILESLKGLGLSISIDDFGTGYSSLSYLKRFPIDVLKIDQSFVGDMLSNLSDEAIVDAIISLGRSLNMQLVAEGVETEAQVRALSAKGCHIVQGFYYCRPIPYSEMCVYLAKGTHKKGDPL